MLLRGRQRRQRVVDRAGHDVERDAAARARGDRLGVEQARRRARLDLRIDRHREHDRAIAVVDDERRGDRLAGRVVEAREPHAAVSCRARARRPRAARSPRCRRAATARRARPTRGATAGAARSCPCAARRGRRRCVVTTPVPSVASAGAIASAMRLAPPADGELSTVKPAGPSRCTRFARTRDGSASGSRSMTSHVSASSISARASAAPARSSQPGARQDVERRRARPGVAHHAQLARVEQRDLDGAAIQRREAHEIAGRDAGAVIGLGRAADQHVELGARACCGRRATTAAASRGRGTARRGRRAREHAPLRFERAKRVRDRAPRLRRSPCACLQRYHARRRCRSATPALRRQSCGRRYRLHARGVASGVCSERACEEAVGSRGRCGTTTSESPSPSAACACSPTVRESFTSAEACDDVVVLGAQERARRVDEAPAGRAQRRARRRGSRAGAPRSRRCRSRAGASAPRGCGGARRCREHGASTNTTSALPRSCVELARPPAVVDGERARVRDRSRGGRGGAAPRASWRRRRSRRCGRGWRGARRSRASCRRRRRSSRRSAASALGDRGDGEVGEQLAAFVLRFERAALERGEARTGSCASSTTSAVSVHAPARVASPRRRARARVRRDRRRAGSRARSSARAG